MLTDFFKGIFDSDLTQVISVSDFLFTLFVSLALGVLFAFAYSYRSKTTRSFLFSVSILPAVVACCIMMVNGNIGAGVAVAGAFSLVRFRSVAGSAREISAVFFTMTVGLLTGMGYLGFGVMFTLVLAGAFALGALFEHPAKPVWQPNRTLRITIPEDLDYENVFDDLLSDACAEYELTQVKTTNMGSLFRLTYDVRLKAQGAEKKLIDALRCRNGNLEITLSKQEHKTDTL